MTASLAAVILAHDDPVKVGRLIDALAGADVYLHCDRRTASSLAGAMTAGRPEVGLIDRRVTTLSSWSLVDAELAGLRLALDRSAAEHIAVMSGACYPLASVSDLQDELAGSRGRSRFELHTLPYPGWSSRLHPDGGRWRFRRRFLMRGDQIVTVRGLPVPTFRRAVPPGLQLRASAQWKVYARAHAQAVLDALDRSPQLRSFWHDVYTPDESCAASVLQSPELVGEIVEQVDDELPWYIKWPPGGAFHPDWLSVDDLPELQRAAAARKLFARKIGSTASELLDGIDERLRRA